MGDVKRKIWFAATVVFAICLTIFTLSHIVTEPWHVIPDIGGDGAKNNFTYLYESMYGKGYWFDGMNYPYGEHIVYTDGIPLLSVLFVNISNVSAETALTILWLLLGVSYVLSVIFLYLILVHFRVTSCIAMVFAGLITIFTPQLFCLSGHYALGFVCVIPMLFYWTIKYNAQPRARYSYYFFILGVVMSFLHPYYAGMMLVWVLFYAAGYILIKRDIAKRKVRHLTPLFVSVALVLFLFAMTMKLTDPIKDRPATPYYTLETCTSKKQIISSAYSPYWQLIMKATHFSKVSDGGEGYTYPGLVVLISVFVSLFLYAIAKFKKTGSSGNRAADDAAFSPVWLFMALGVLLFSMGVPFIWIWDINWLSKYVSVVMQFRALGRFSWIFYYIVTVYSAVTVYKWYIRLVSDKRPGIAFSLLALSIIVWSYEASGYIRFSRGRADYALYNYDMMFSKKEQNWESFLHDHHFDKSDFQAILALPFFHVGTEKVWVDADWVLTMGTKAALQLRLPIVDVMLSRSSWSQAEKQLKIAAGPYAGKPILDDIRSNKPFLLMRLDFDTLDPDQKYLLQACDPIGHFSQCYVYACYPDRLRKLAVANADSIARTLHYMHSEDTCVTNAGAWYVQHFDSSSSGEAFFGAGAMPGIGGAEASIGAFPVKVSGDSQLYEFSCWFLLDERNARSPFVTLQMICGSGMPDTAFTRQSVDNKGMWFRDSKYFYIHKNVTAVRCSLINVPCPAYKAMDEVMLRPSDAVIVSRAADGSVMVNNHLLNEAKQK